MRIRLMNLLGIAIVLGLSGFVHGKWTNRWAGSAEAAGRDLLAPLDRLIGGFQPGEMLAINPADAPPRTTTVSRQFNRVKGGKPVIVSICSGFSGEVAVHTPDVCFLGAGYKLKSAVRRELIPLADGKETSFWTADFEKTTASSSETIRVRWNWTADGDWRAPDYPRFVFGRAPVLYKLYIVHSLTDDEDLTRDDPYRTFAAELVTALNRQLTP